MGTLAQSATPTPEYTFHVAASSAGMVRTVGQFLTDGLPDHGWAVLRRGPTQLPSVTRL